jgi:dienelactone hydrolase
MERKVSYYSDGLKIAGMLFEPEAAADNSCPGIVMCQGMVGIKEYFWFPHIARHFVNLGCVVLTWDYRGVGESEGEYGRLYPLEMAADIGNALTYLQIHPKVDPGRLVLMGWSHGGAMVPYVAGVDERVKCTVSIVGWSDGRRSLRNMRSPADWLTFLDRIEKDKEARVLTGKSELLAPGEILGRDPSTNKDVERELSKIPGMENATGTPYSLATAEKIIEFRPIDVVDRISPRPIFYIAAGRDTLTPAEDIVEMYRRTGEPKKLWVIPGIDHHNVYEEPYMSQVLEVSTTWLKENLG